MSGEDDLSIKTIKKAQKELEPLLLRLVNMTIMMTMYPERLKMKKIMPVEKTGKDLLSSYEWRPVNVIVALSKVIERVLLKQLLEHLEENKLVNNQTMGR